MKDLDLTLKKAELERHDYVLSDRICPVCSALLMEKHVARPNLYDGQHGGFYRVFLQCVACGFVDTFPAD